MKPLLHPWRAACWCPTAFPASPRTSSESNPVLSPQRTMPPSSPARAAITECSSRSQRLTADGRCSYARRSDFWAVNLQREVPSHAAHGKDDPVSLPDQHPTAARLHSANGRPSASGRWRRIRARTFFSCPGVRSRPVPGGGPCARPAGPPCRPPCTACRCRTPRCGSVRPVARSPPG